MSGSDTMKLLDALISTLNEDSLVKEIHACVFWTTVLSKHCGLASSFHEEHPYHRPVRGVGSLTGMLAVELAQYAKSDNPLEASIGMATINSLIDVDEARCVEENAFDILVREGMDKKIAIVGHFPWVPKLRAVARKLWVIEQRPEEGDLPTEAAESILPQADVVGITGTSFINHTVEKLLELSKSSFTIMVGPTSPLSPVLFDYGVDVIAGVKVVEPEKTIRCISEGAIFSQIRGVKLITMINPKHEIRNPKQYQSTNDQNSKQNEF